MPIRFPPLKSIPAVLADWIEVRTLVDQSGFFRLNKLKRYWDTQRETEASDPAGQHRPEENTDEDGVSGGDDDAFLDALTDELSDRITALDTAYPFQFEKGGLRLSLKENLSEGAYMYLFCLLLTHCKAGEVMNGSVLPAVNNRIRDLFQACSTLAAAGVVRGCAISFGWPRPNNNPPFLVKLKEVYARFGEGSIVDTPRPGTSPMVKDAEIDIIAWHPRPDRAPGTEYLLGQVASGDNWTCKSIKGGGIAAFHTSWFTMHPASEPIASIFIPHVVLPVAGETRRERMHILSPEFGRMYDRLSLPRYAGDGMLLADDASNNLHIERRTDIPEIVEWVLTQIASLKVAGAIPL
jgi:hypothetical protein